MVDASEQSRHEGGKPSIRSNLGESLFELGRYDEALEQFRRSTALFEQRQDARSARDGYWHVAHALRALNRNPEALAIQLRLERECDAAGAPKVYIFEELEILFQRRQRRAGTVLRGSNQILEMSRCNFAQQPA